MYQPSPVNPALAQVIGAMDVIKPVTPEGTPTVASQVMQAAQQAMAPQPAMPNVQQIARDAGIGNQVQMGQQQEQQQQMMQMLQQMMQQRQGRENAMRFGVAAAPGADTIRMAEGGIVGYAAGNLTSERLARLAAEQADEEARARAGSRFDPRTPEEAREMAQRRAAAQARLSTPTPEISTAGAGAAAESRGVGSLLRRVGGRMLGPAAALFPVYEALKTPESRAETEDFFRNLLGFGPANREAPPYSNEGRNDLIERNMRENFSVEGRNYPAGSDIRSGIGEFAAAATAGGEDIGTPPRPTPSGGVAQLPLPPMRTSRAGEFQQQIGDLIKGYEVEGPKAADVQRRIAENAEITNAALRAAGLKPDQRALDEAESQARQTRREEGIAGLRKASEEARGGLNRTIALLSAAANSSNPLAMIGIRHGQLVAQDLAENERFTNSLERIRTEGEVERVALREKARADVIGDVKTAREQEAKIVDARNKRREAEISAATEFYKAERSSEEKDLDRRANFMIENMRISAQQAQTQAMREGNLEMRRAGEARRIEADLARNVKDIERLHRDRVRDLQILDKPTPEQQRTLNRLEAERDAAISKLELTASQLRAQIAGGTGGGGIKVEPLKPSK